MFYLDNNSTPKRNFRNVMNRAINRINHKSREQTPSSDIFPTKNIFDEIEEQNKISLSDGKTIINVRNISAFNEQCETMVDGNSNKNASLVMEPKSRTLMRRFVLNLRSNKTNRLWRLPLDHEDTTEEYVVK